MGRLARKAFYIFLLGVSTYAWWKLTRALKEKMDEADRG